MNAVEYTKFGPMFIVGAPGHISIMLTNSIGARVISRAVASADYMAHEEWWWIGRVLVQRDKERGKGIGSLILQRLLKTATTALTSDSLNPVPHVVVAPGGYSDDLEGQMRFYRRNGFEPDPREPDLLHWRAK